MRKIKTKIIAVGLCTDQENNIFSGQAMMFEAFVNFLKDEEYKVSIINLTSKYTDIQVGKIDTKRVIEYMNIIYKAIPIFIKNRGGILYITTAQTKGGFIRDFIFINIAYMLKYKILIQQFGSNFQIFYNSLSPIFKFLVKSTFNKGNKIIVEGEVTQKQFSMLDDYSTKVVPITNGLPEKNIKPSPCGKILKTNETLNLIYLSYMIESKGYWSVLEAVNILVKELNNNIHCTFAGVFKTSVDDEIFKTEIEASKAFHEYIKENKLENNITYFKGLMGEKKADYFKKAHFFLLPSYFKFEGQPVSVLEAMAYGCVPIVTKYRMIPDMVTEETGIFVEKKSPIQIAEKINYLINNPTIYANLSQGSLDRFKNNFTLEMYCKKLITKLRQL